MTCIEDNLGDIDVILLDLQMTVMDGFEVLHKRLKNERFQRIPVIVLTENGAMNDQMKAFGLGASDFISKPFEFNIMISRIGNVLQARRRTIVIAKSKEDELSGLTNIEPMTGLYNKATSERVIRNYLK